MIVRLPARVFALLLASSLSAATAEEEIPRETVRGYNMLRGVNARNGNFSLTYPAFENVAGAIPYRRTYNSLSTNTGVFGQGWGSVFDTRVVTLADRRVAVRENGNGAIALYGQFVWPETRVQLEEKVAEAEKAPADHGAARREKVALNHAAALKAQVCDNAWILRDPWGWTRGVCPFGIQQFDKAGRLVSWDDGSGPVTIARRNGDIVRVTRIAGGALHFLRQDNRLHVTGSKGGVIAYTFDAKGRNVQMSGTITPTMTFSYDARGNMTDLDYGDGTHVRITYDDRDRVTQHVDREGREQIFDYRGGMGRSETLVKSVSGTNAVSRIYAYED